MAVFSDKTILRKLSELIEDGDSDRVRGCSYSFVPGKIFPSPYPNDAERKKVVDWSIRSIKEWPGEEAFEICPGELISLRTRETVNIPENVCGIWNQTDALSRKGLLLVNLSTVPPGYRGHLTCTFVNFGKQNVRIQPDTRIAKLMFLELDEVAVRQSSPFDTRRYDSNMATMASESPATFLQISDQSRALKELIEKGKVQLKNSADEFAADTKIELASQLSSMKVDFKESMASDAQSVLLKATPLALIAVSLLAAGQWIATNFLTDHVDVLAKQRADQIEQKIDEQLESIQNKPVFVYSGTEESKALLERMNSLEDQIRNLEAKQK